jgi:hypothetical protein
LECEVNIACTQLFLRALPFQEQCGEVATCGAIALWSAFQVVQDTYGTPSAPSPREITLAAKGFHPKDATQFKSKLIDSRDLELSLTEMQRGIRRFGYHHLTEQVREKLPVRSLIYGYLRMGFPVILNAVFDDEVKHAVLVSDFSEIGSTPHSDSPSTNTELFVTDESESNFRLRGQRITHFLAHDDQVGPFCRLKTVETTIPAADTQRRKAAPHAIAFQREWCRTVDDPFHKKNEDRRILHPSVVVPVVPHHVRLEFSQAIKWLTPFTGKLCETLANLAGPELSGCRANAEWDVYLVRAKEYKRMLTTERDSIPEGTYERLIRKHYPMYLWRCQFIVGQKSVLEVLIDATASQFLHKKHLSQAGTWPEVKCPVIHVEWFDQAAGKNVYEALYSSQESIAIEQRHFLGESENKREIDRLVLMGLSSNLYDTIYDEVAEVGTIDSLVTRLQEFRTKFSQVLANKILEAEFYRALAERREHLIGQYFSTFLSGFNFLR